MWNPRGLPYRPIPVATSSPAPSPCASAPSSSTPRGLVGGELYLNELESLDGALKRRSSVV